jgi:hypothetical protein
MYASKAILTKMATVKTLKRYKNTITTIHATQIDQIIEAMIERCTEDIDFPGLTTAVPTVAATYEPELVHLFKSMKM